MRIRAQRCNVTSSRIAILTAHPSVQQRAAAVLFAIRSLHSMAETTTRHDAWQAGDSYDLYMGRWSRQVAPRFLDWLGARAGGDWLDLGCGTGALSAAILQRYK